MKTPSILVLLISMLLFGCDKEENIGFTSFSGKDIDSIGKYYINDNNDTTLDFTWKYIYSNDKNFITEKMYSRLGASDSLTLTKTRSLKIEHQKLIVIDYFFGGYTTWVYRLNKNYCIISRVITQSISLDLDSTSYEYYNEGYLYKANTIRFINKNKDSILFSSNRTYYWTNGNLTYSISSGSAPLYNPNEKFYERYQYTELTNPLGYFYNDNNLQQPYLKFGKSSKNLMSNYNSKVDYNGYINDYYSYILSLNANSFNYIISNQPTPNPKSSFTKIFYK